MPITCRLREMMAEKKLKQFEVAIATKLSPTIIGNLYHNQFRRIDCKTAEKLCNYFGCELGELFQLTDPPSASSVDSPPSKLKT